MRFLDKLYFVVRSDVSRAPAMHPCSASVLLSAQSLCPLPQDLSTIHCLDCRSALDWHQPDSQAPERMLGVCLQCGGWHLLDLAFEADAAAFVLLTVSRSLQEISVD